MQVDHSSRNAPSLAALGCVLGDLSQADGSASLTYGNTVVLAAAYGPCEVKVSKGIMDKATVDVTCIPIGSSPDCANMYREWHIRDLFQATVLVSQHPRSSITIVLQDMEDDGDLLATSINAACLALLDAGVNMKFLVAAVTAVIDKDGNVNLTPQKKQTSAELSATLTLVFSEKDISIMGATTSGTFTEEQYDRCVALCREAIQLVFKFYRESLEKKLSKSVSTFDTCDG